MFFFPTSGSMKAAAAHVSHLLQLSWTFLADPATRGRQPVDLQSPARRAGALDLRKKISIFLRGRGLLTTFSSHQEQQTPTLR